MLASSVQRVPVGVFFEWGMRCILGRISTFLTIFIRLFIEPRAVRHMVKDAIFTKQLQN